MQIVTAYGAMWARNTKNIRRIPASGSGGKGVYILFDGSMPVYVGNGNIRHGITDARRSKRRGQLWDRFSWYVLGRRHRGSVFLRRGPRALPRRAHAERHWRHR
jgi:hypothetical protein